MTRYTYTLYLFIYLFVNLFIHSYIWRDYPRRIAPLTNHSMWFGKMLSDSYLATGLQMFKTATSGLQYWMKTSSSISLSHLTVLLISLILLTVVECLWVSMQRYLILQVLLYWLRVSVLEVIIGSNQWKGYYSRSILLNYDMMFIFIFILTIKGARDAELCTVVQKMTCLRQEIWLCASILCVSMVSKSSEPGVVAFSMEWSSVNLISRTKWYQLRWCLT